MFQVPIRRDLEAVLERWLFRGKVLILYGARQVGKTTLSKALLQPYAEDGAYFNCEIQSVRSALSVQEPASLRRLTGGKKIVVFDEAQHVPDIGRVLKILHDTFPDLQIIATGSSSFELANRSAEPLTGRALQFDLMPLSYAELAQAMPLHERRAQLEFWLRFGMYPEIALATEGQAQVLLDNLSSQYLYRDVLEFENLKRADVLVKLLQLLALQVGQLVSYHEIGNALGISSVTVARYVDLLEKAFAIFRLYPFSRNLRSEIGKKHKIYFYDTGIRNSIIQQYQPLSVRLDKGALWENFLVSERLKWLSARQQKPNRYFWRTHEGYEIDYLEESGGQLNAYEFKWQERRVKAPPAFLNAYPGSVFSTVDQQNFEEFVT